VGVGGYRWQCIVVMGMGVVMCLWVLVGTAGSAL
jgi:hypothetical protein